MQLVFLFVFSPQNLYNKSIFQTAFLVYPESLRYAYILTILDRAGRQPLQSNPVHKQKK